MDKLVSMNTFLAVARAGSFGSGAEQVQISKAMASKHIAYLEDALGVRLFNRNTRGVRLTEAGETYRLHCESILRKLAEAEAQVADDHNDIRGTLRVVAPISFGTFHLTPALAAYKHQCAKVRVQLTLDDRPTDLVESNYDVAIRVGSLPDSSFVARPIAYSCLIVCAAPEYLDKRGRPRTLADLTGHNCLRYINDRHRAGWLFEHADFSGRYAVDGNFTATAAEAVRVAALNGCGLAQLPLYMVSDDLAGGLLEAVLLDFQPTPQPIHALYAHRHFLPRTIRSFVDFLSERFHASATCPPNGEMPAFTFKPTAELA